MSSILATAVQDIYRSCVAISITRNNAALICESAVLYPSVCAYFQMPKTRSTSYITKVKPMVSFITGCPTWLACGWESIALHNFIYWRWTERPTKVFVRLRDILLTCCCNFLYRITQFSVIITLNLWCFENVLSNSFDKWFDCLVRFLTKSCFLSTVSHCKFTLP